MPCFRSAARVRPAIAAAAFALLAAAHAQTPPLVLEVTVGSDPDPSSCADADTLAITAGDLVNFCYTIRNDGDEALAFHTLADDVNGTLLHEFEHLLQPGASFQYNDLRVVTSSQELSSTWTAASALPAYEVRAATAGPDTVFASGFEPGEAPGFAFEEIAGTGNDLGLDDDGEATVAIGFEFRFFGEASTVVRVGNNGGLLFGTETGELGYNNLPLPNATLGPAILPYWDDFDSEGGAVYAQTLGTAPARRLVIEWKERLHYDGAQNSDPATFQAILHEGSNAIVFQYADTDLDGTEWDNGASATIGLNRGDLAEQYAYDSASVAAGSVVLFAPLPRVVHEAGDVVTIDAGAPDIEVAPAAITASVAAGGSTSAALDVGNAGNRDLEWSLVEAPGAMAAPRALLPARTDARVDSRMYAPRTRVPALVPPDKAQQLPSGAEVPAFGVNLHVLEGNTLVALDAAHPAVTTKIGAVARTLVGGAFLGDDFSRLYTLDFDSGELVVLDTSDAGETVIGTAATLGEQDWSGLALDRTNGTLYASSTLMAGGLASTLYTIDPATGAATAIGPIDGGGRVIEIAADPAGQLYGVDIAGDVLVAIDKATGDAVAVGPLGFDAEFAEGLDFDPASGILYFAAVANESVFSQPGRMYVIDPATGHATLIGGISADPASAQVSAFAIAVAGGACATPSGVPWLAVDPAGGTTAPGTVTGVTVDIDAATLAPGEYRATLCIGSNDPDQPNVAVPVTLTVS